MTGISYLTNDLDDNETKNVYVYLKDRANNVSPAKTDSIFLLADQNPPTLSAATIQDIGSGTNNASMTDNKTVRINITAVDNTTTSGASSTGMKYVLVTDNTSTYTDAYVATTIGDNLTLFDSLVTSGIIQSATWAADNTTSVDFTFANSSSATGAAQSLKVWVADAAKNFAGDNGTHATSIAPASIYVDDQAPTIDNVTITGSVSDNLTASDNTSFTSSTSVTIRLDYTDDYNGTNVYQYVIFEADNSSLVSTNQYTDNITGDNMTGFTVGSDKQDPSDNLSGIGRPPSFWSILDNQSNDNISGNPYYADSYNDNLSNAHNNTSNLSYTLSSSGTTTLHIWVKDAAGNIATKSSKSIVLDNVSPTGTQSNLSFGGSDLSADESRTDNLTIQIDNNTLFSDGDGVGVYRLYFTDNGSAAPTDNSSTFWNRIPNGNSDNLTFTFTMDSSGGSIGNADNLTLYVYAIDNLSNYDNTTAGRLSLSIMFDNATPTASGDNVTLDNSSNVVITADNQTLDQPHKHFLR